MNHSDVHALTIDVEDWFHVCNLQYEPVIARSRWRVHSATERILSLLAVSEIKATFFILGSVAEAETELAGLITSQGHEIASHGWSHRLVHEMTADEFKAELERTAELIFKQTGARPVGYRAPRWSISERTPWAHEILVEQGYLYDSSCNPLPLVGNGRAPRRPYSIQTGKGALWEVPPMVTPTPMGNLPTGGGWGFRLFPLPLISSTIRRYQKAGHPAVLYLHPREVDPLGPRLDLSPLQSFAAYGTRNDAAPRITALLKTFRFTTLESMVRSWKLVS
ncbi:polysaccharide deacetylase family protein [Pelotalea chapellei]|uniref:polysaccharide deacetylase family protein n=1 Tax=Pelotalea chapellei TaxID=44671 RepID=UPI003462BC77